MTDYKKAEELIAKLFRIACELKELTGRPFTLDGHLVGSIGEVFASIHYGIELHKASHPIHDGVWRGREVQIKATQRNSVDLKGQTDLLLVFKVKPDGTCEEIYNGDGRRPWLSLAHRKTTKAGEISISLTQLRKLNEQVLLEDRIDRLEP